MVKTEYGQNISKNMETSVFWIQWDFGNMGILETAGNSGILEQRYFGTSGILF